MSERVSGEGGMGRDCVAMLKEDYAGMVSALTQNMEYQYQHIYLHATHSKLCALFHKLEEAEEYLLHQVGGLIRDLGGDPQYEGMMSGQWTATYLKYYKMPMEMLRHDMESERAAIAQAEEHKRMCREPRAADMFGRIAEAHREHLAMLQAAMDGHEYMEDDPATMAVAMRRRRRGARPAARPVRSTRKR
jgi:bacterioferritin (cytochrome b1)